ncbi:MAG TPA: homoserine dehydrogenase [Anaerolineaceae bacterium]|nr:homoserine dehydrogenase [Anaerolineaceae bacterium]
MSQVSLALVGFGNVGQALSRLLIRKQATLAAQYDVTFRVVGIATGHHGICIDPDGIDLEKSLALVGSGQSLAALSAQPAPDSVTDFIQVAPADILFENSPTNHETGQPAIAYLSAAFERGMHAITANKGPIVHGYNQLTELAKSKGKRFLFESTVMDGAPIFSIFRAALPAVDLRGFHGILNSCTNMILGRMEKGESLEQAIAYAQSIGIAETDPSEDVDGWDASIKVAALVTVLMGIPVTPDQVDRQGIRKITREMIAEAEQAGERWKLVCTAYRQGNALRTRVAPERVTPDSPLFSINGTSSYVEFETDVLPGLGIVENNPSPETTAYGLLADMINVLRNS